MMASTSWGMLDSSVNNWPAIRSADRWGGLKPDSSVESVD